jgi:hypothetical protein
LEHVRKNHPALVMAALTILRGFHVVGMPKAEVAEYGSFVAWSDMVRHAVLWLNLPDLPDPCLTRRAILDAGDGEKDWWQEIIELLPRYYDENKMVTIGSLIKQVEECVFNDEVAKRGRTLFESDDDEVDAAKRMKMALLSVTKSKTGKINAAIVGIRFKQKRNTPINGMRLEMDSDTHSKVNRWHVGKIEKIENKDC